MPTKMTKEKKLQFWASHFKAAKEFSGPLRDYCQQEGISLFSYYYWMRQSKRPGLKKKDSGTEKSAPFVKVQVETQANRSSQLPDPKWLAEFLTQLNRASK